jgi:RNA polymerase sigma-70 factor (ECF subfamily)
LDNPDKDFITRLKGNPNKTLIGLYRDYRKEFLSWSWKAYKVEEEVAADCFQDAIIVLYKNIVDKKLTVLSSSVKTYLFSIGKNLLLNKLKSKYRETSLTELTPETEKMELMDLFEGTSREKRIADLVLKIKDPCKSILRYFYYHKFSMQEIAEKMNYKNAHTVKSQKVRCIKELQELFRREEKKSA